MPLYVKDQQVDALAEQLAALRGTSKSHPRRAPEKTMVEMEGPTMNPTPINAGEAAADSSSSPPV